MLNDCKLLAFVFCCFCSVFCALLWLYIPYELILGWFCSSWLLVVYSRYTFVLCRTSVCTYQCSSCGEISPFTVPVVNHLCNKLDQSAKTETKQPGECDISVNKSLTHMYQWMMVTIVVLQVVWIVDWMIEHCAICNAVQLYRQSLCVMRSFLFFRSHCGCRLLCQTWLVERKKRCRVLDLNRCTLN